MKTLLVALLLAAPVYAQNAPTAPTPTLLGTVSGTAVESTPYIVGLWGTGLSHPMTSAGALFQSNGKPVDAISGVSVAYHKAGVGGSVIPEALQPYIPAESWAIDASYGGGAGNYVASLSACVNLAATVQGYASEAFLASKNASLDAFGALIKPGASPLSIAAGPAWYVAPVVNGTVLPVDAWQGKQGWVVKLAYQF